MDKITNISIAVGEKLTKIWRVFKRKPKLIKYKIIKKDDFLDYKISHDIRIYKEATLKNLINIAKYLKRKTPKIKIHFNCFYLPEMTVDAGAYAVVHFRPEMEARFVFYEKL